MDTIKEFIQHLDEAHLKPARPEDPSYKDAMMDTVYVWSNDACKGYALRAAVRSGMDEEQIRNFLNEMRWAFNDMTEEEAEHYYQHDEWREEL